MECDKAKQLLRAYNKEALALSAAVQHLLNGGGLVAREVYVSRRHAAEKARIDFELARLAYEDHIREHHCGGGAGSGGTELEMALHEV